MSTTKRVVSEFIPILIFVATGSSAVTDAVGHKEKILIKINVVVTRPICDLKDKIILRI